MPSAGGHVATETFAPASASAFAIAKPKPPSSATPATNACFPLRSIASMGGLIARNPSGINITSLLMRVLSDQRANASERGQFVLAAASEPTYRSAHARCHSPRSFGIGRSRERRSHEAADRLAEPSHRIDAAVSGE